MYSFQRGYPCALWQLLHTATVGMTDDNAAAEMGNMIAFITEFFECKDCRDHFIEMSNTIKANPEEELAGTGKTLMTTLTSRKEAVLWLWRAHNTVSARILKQESEEGANPFKSDRTLHAPADSLAVWLCPHAAAAALSVVALLSNSGTRTRLLLHIQTLLGT